jgi:ferritin-like protein
MYQINLDAVDSDGAIREAAEVVASDTRLDFLRKATVAGGAVVGGGAILGALAPAAMAASTRPPSSFGKGDTGILNYALTLEYLESAFYTEAKHNLLSRLDGQGQQFLRTVQSDEATHVAALRSALGRAAVKKPKFNFGAAVTDPATFLATSYVLENTGVHAYLGQAPNIKEAKVLLTAASILTVEARHAGAIAVITGKKINANGAFDNGYSASKVLKAVAGTGFIV